MQKPDANGFVNVMWPSKNVPHGGVFHTRIVEPNEKQREYLKLLLDETKMSIEQRQQCKWESQLRKEQEVARTRRRQPTSYIRPKTSKRRSLSAIRESGMYDDDGYRPLKRGEDRERLKERLQRAMAYGDTEQEPPSPPKLPSSVKKVPELPNPKQVKNELLTQIRERAEWLAEMEMLGEAARHRNIIQDQIAERLRALEALGIDSPMSSARSTASGFSTLRSTEPLAALNSVRSHGSERSVRSNSSQEKRSAKASARARPGKGKIEENVLAYNDIPSLTCTKI